MYQWIAKQKIRQGFAAISRGEFDGLLGQFAPDIHFSFVGSHALGGEFHQRETVRAWFERVHRLFPRLCLEPLEIHVSGLPWDMVVFTRFRVSDTLPDGSVYENRGVQMLRIRLGKIVEDHLLEDTLYLADILGRLAALGRAEASAPPLEDAR